MVATALTACGIETMPSSDTPLLNLTVATALTACGIETGNLFFHIVDDFSSCNSTYRLRY